MTSETAGVRSGVRKGRAARGEIEPASLQSRPKGRRKLFRASGFQYNEANEFCVCPAGHELYRSGKHMLFNGYRVAHFKAPISACRDCRLRSRCLRHPERTAQRQVCIIEGREGACRPQGGPVERMRWKFDTAVGRAIYSRPMATVEPVFANIQNEGMRRFTLRDRRKVNAQWQLY